MPVTPRFVPASGYDEVDAKRRVPKLVRALESAYPGVRTALHHRNPFELLIATILSAQSTDVRVNEITPVLFGRFPTPHDLAEADPGEVERIVHPTGFFRQKTKSVIGCSSAILERYGGEVPRTMDELVTLPGVARKTANVVLANCWPHTGGQGIFVDTHVARTAQRLALTPRADPVKIERDLMAVLPKRKWVDVPHQLIELGRGPCEAKRPRHLECPLLRWCPTGQATTAQRAARTDATTAQRAARSKRTRKATAAAGSTGRRRTRRAGTAG